MKQVIKPILILVGIWLGIELLTRLIVEILWFQEVGYLSYFLKRLFWQFILFLGIAGISAAFLLTNLRYSHKHKWHSMPQSLPRKSSLLRKSKTDQLTPQSIPLRLPWLLFLVGGCYVLIGLILFYYSHLTIQIWTPRFNLSNLSTPPSLYVGINWIFKLIPTIGQNILIFTLVIGVLAFLFFTADFWSTVIALIFSILFGLIFAGNWANILKYFNPTDFDEFDPQFYKDISFYIFSLPIWGWLFLWLAGLFIYALLSTTLIYLLSANSISEGKFPGFSRIQLRHLYGLWGGAMAVLVWRHLLNRYELLYDSRGVIYGAGYTDVHIRQYIEIGLGLIAGISSFWLLFKSFTGATRQKLNPHSSRSRVRKLSYYTLKTWYKLPFYLWFILFYLLVLISGFITSEIVQVIWVQPNELAKETPYIARSIAYTRAGFDLDKIDAKIFEPEGRLTAQEIRENVLTIENVRIWDTQPLLQTNRQLQQIRLYYKFPTAEIDRYQMLIESTEQNDPFAPDIKKTNENPKPLITATKNQQVIIAARELDYEAVPEQAKTWVNKHLVYTHGYGFTLSPVNLVAEGGLPYYFVKDIGTSTDQGALQTSSEYIQYSIPITKPRIYYGQMTNTYVMTSTRVQELDFPSGEENVYNTYDGTGGINIGSWWRRGLFAIYLKDWQMIFTRDFLKDTKLLFRRPITERIQAIAPFLQYDQDPYLVVADIKNPSKTGAKNTLYWIVDAYTISDRYPYSDPGDNQFNYIRNSVKVTIDAYNGDVNFYIADPSDPIIRSWEFIIQSNLL